MPINPLSLLAVSFETNLPEDKVRKLVEVLRTVYDPEIPINVYDLGLIYEIRIDEESVVHVKMSMTSIGCPLTSYIAHEVGRAVKSAIPEAKDVVVDVVFDPPWTPTRMTKEGRELFKALYGYDIVEEFERGARGL